MYTVYFVLVIILIISFITGNIVLFSEHKLNKKERNKSKEILEKSVVLENTIITTNEEVEDDKPFFEEPILIPIEIVEDNNLIMDEELL